MSRRTSSEPARGRRRGSGATSPAGRAPASREWLAPGLLVVATGYAFHNALHGGFLYDDVPAVVDNRSILSIAGSLRPPPDTPVTGRPVANLSLALNHMLGGMSTTGYHVFNVVVHLLSALLLFAVVRRALLSPTLRDRFGADASWLALAVSALWAVHPLQTESVTYVTQRTELLMGFFLLLTLYGVQRGIDAPPRVSAGWYGAAVLACWLGVGSKEVTVVAPIVVLGYDLLILGTPFRDIGRQRGALYAGLATTWGAFLVLARTRFNMDHAMPGAAAVTPWQYLMTQSAVIVHYLRLSLLPVGLVADYADWPLAKSLGPTLPSAAVVLALLGLTVWAVMRRPALGFLGLAFFAVLAPSSSVWPIASELAAERRMYLPLACVIALVVLGVYAAIVAPAARKTAAAVAAIAVVLLAQGSVRRNEVFDSQTTFWSDVVAKRPNDWRGQMGLGVELANAGNLDAAIARYTAALQSNPDFAPARVNMGHALLRQGKPDQAAAYYMEAIRLNPTVAVAHSGLADALVALGRTDEAIGHYNEALRLDPNLAQAHTNLAIVLGGAGRQEEAISHFAEAARLAPSGVTELNLGNAFAIAGRDAESVAHLEAALRMDPSLTAARQSLDAVRARQGK